MSMSTLTVSTASAAGSSTKQRSACAQCNDRTSEEELARLIVPKLAARAYHLPGYSCCRDWGQYMLNNHPLLGICCHHRLHPLRKKQRLIMFLGSFGFGVAITNIIYLWFLTSDTDKHAEVFTFSYYVQDEEKSASLTKGTVALVTVGSGLHALFDRVIWGISACAFCRPGGACESLNWCQNAGQYVVVLVVIFVSLAATLVVVMRASLDEGETEIPVYHNSTFYFNEISELDVPATQDVSFLVGYAVEFVVSLFIYYPLIGTVLFSGVLGCKQIPVLGGRPREIRQERRRLEQRASNIGSATVKSEDDDTFDHA